MEDPETPAEKIVGMDCIGARIFTRLSMNLIDFCAMILLIERVLGASPPDLSKASAEGRFAAVELSDDHKIATIVLQRPLKPEEATENGEPLRKTFNAQVIRLHTCNEELITTTLLIDVRFRNESAWMIRNCFDEDLQSTVIRYLAETVQ